MAIALACVFAVAQPLDFSLREMLVQTRADAEIQQIIALYFPNWAESVYELSTETALRDGTVFLNVYATAPENLIKSEHVKLLHQIVANRLNLPVDIDFHLLPYTSIAFHPNRSP
jgi:hypothetical protein